MGERTIDARSDHLRARGGHVRDARRRAAVHRTDGAGDPRARHDGGAASDRRPAQVDPGSRGIRRDARSGKATGRSLGFGARIRGGAARTDVGVGTTRRGVDVAASRRHAWNVVACAAARSARAHARRRRGREPGARGLDESRRRRPAPRTSCDSRSRRCRVNEAIRSGTRHSPSRLTAARSCTSAWATTSDSS